MAKKSLDQIAEYYITSGLKGERLRRTLESDREYQALLSKKKKRIIKKFKIKDLDREKYLLSEERDFEILHKIYKLEKKNLSKTDMELLKLLRTQLEEDWRLPILKILNKLLNKYGK